MNLRNAGLDATINPPRQLPLVACHQGHQLPDHQPPQCCDIRGEHCRSGRILGENNFVTGRAVCVVLMHCYQSSRSRPDGRLGHGLSWMLKCQESSKASLRSAQTKGTQHMLSAVKHMLHLIERLNGKQTKCTVSDEPEMVWMVVQLSVHAPGFPVYCSLQFGVILDHYSIRERHMLKLRDSIAAAVVILEVVAVIWLKVVWLTGHLANSRLADSSYGRQVVLPTGRLANSSYGRQLIWPIGRIADRSFSRQLVWPTGRLADRSFGRQVVWPTDRLADRSFGRRVVWPTGHLDDGSFGRQVIWPTGRLTDRSFGRHIFLERITMQDE
ncbi:hypothetical protein M513_07870 [Trichuris suis]|uniref:Uncharacterized protein n=1 Tax=Trichuris suis TaxID=68888 RepID=A0A085M224_9BILA|nr:hypothetical protein M513_07870 [Trichuris suis]